MGPISIIGKMVVVFCDLIYKKRQSAGCLCITEQIIKSSEFRKGGSQIKISPKLSPSPQSHTSQNSSYLLETKNCETAASTEKVRFCFEILHHPVCICFRNYRVNFKKPVKESVLSLRAQPISFWFGDQLRVEVTKFESKGVFCLVSQFCVFMFCVGVPA